MAGTRKILGKITKDKVITVTESENTTTIRVTTNISFSDQINKKPLGILFNKPDRDLAVALSELRKWSDIINQGEYSSAGKKGAALDKERQKIRSHSKCLHDLFMKTVQVATAADKLNAENAFAKLRVHGELLSNKIRAEERIKIEAIQPQGSSRLRY